MCAGWPRPHRRHEPSLWRQVHRQQTDLKRVGWLFVALFVPGALLWTYGAGLVLVHQGASAAVAFGWAQAQAHSAWLSGVVVGLMGFASA